jgi:hypothetical protein
LNGIPVNPVKYILNWYYPANPFLHSDPHPCRRVLGSIYP